MIRFLNFEIPRLISEIVSPNLNSPGFSILIRSLKIAIRIGEPF
jgi:hypothetical protein